MTASLIDGKKIASEVKERLKAKVSGLAPDGIPGLAVVLVGDDPASSVYVGQKEKNAREIGINSYAHKLPATTTQENLLALIERLNESPEVHGILVQLPLPRGLDRDAVITAIRPEKDVDGFHVVNVGKLWVGEDSVEPCTPKGIMTLLDSTGVELKGKEAVVIGRSNIVGKPIAAMLLSRHCTVTICHSRTRGLADVARRADIVVAAIGMPNFVTGDMIKPGAIVIDVGINRVDGRLVGDVEFGSASERASWITPVPGGVGPMTIAMLMQNTLQLAGIKI
ncbi:MAG: bifunctional methylenetetrahydrofolate dehydrogenase/methenyltetrahydrofolate cyclohydrolase FolD [Synergistaceae bacterium]|jgi:methylenetetrahydrofolate dehydrogenase (NADP+)/methenyltetrahydrofolate cyclohydrolase|nr:bifunctional methylenetetrahydrofolate dehydrogenase/methenyltetrahydrofolate cyclohydrolase FolD [Synergistaceae bacterium]